jgi:hypothetical protein
MRRLACVLLVACSHSHGALVPDAATTIDASADASSKDMASDDFKRSALGSDWTIVYPPTPPNTQVQIIASTDLGMTPGPEGFFLVNWTKRAFGPDQFSEATIAPDATAGWAYMVYVRWRASDRARYGFAYDDDPNQPLYYNKWIFKYDGVPGPQTRIIASAPGASAPQPGDTLRVEIRGYTLSGYWNGTKVLEATDADPTMIADGVPGLASRWANGNMSTSVDARVWGSWTGGAL